MHAIDSNVNFSGGDWSQACFQNSDVFIDAGEITALFFTDSTLNLSGGEIGRGVIETTNSQLNITNGRFGYIRRSEDSTINISGGILSQPISGGENTIVNISGGSLGSGVFGFSGSLDASGELNFFATEALLNGAPIGLIENEPFVVTDRDVTLSLVLEDGSPYEFQLFDKIAGTVSVTVVPEPNNSWILALLLLPLFRKSSRQFANLGCDKE